MKISDLLDVIEDDTVPIQEKDIIASERIMEVTMAKIHMDEDNNGSARKKRGKGTIALLIAAVVLALSVTAYASGLFSRLVNWQGQTLETETEPMATMPPDAEMIGDEARDSVINSILEMREARELIIVRHDGSASSTERTAPLASVGELAELLTREDTSLTVPITIPEGFTLITGRVSYDSARGYGYTLESTETREDGLVVEHYSASSEGDFISGYALEWENAAGQRITLRADMMHHAENTNFGVWGDSGVYPLRVDGMDDALGIQDENASSIFLRQRLDPSVLCISCHALMAPNAVPVEEFTEYTDVVYMIRADRLTVDDLQALLVF